MFCRLCLGISFLARLSDLAASISVRRFIMLSILCGEGSAKGRGDGDMQTERGCRRAFSQKNQRN